MPSSETDLQEGRRCQLNRISIQPQPNLIRSIEFIPIYDKSRPTEFLDLTSVTLEEFQQLVPPFEAAFQAHMAAWRLDSKPRTARQFTVYKNCTLPTPEDRLFFILSYLKTYALQVVQGRLFGMVQGKANQWIHVLLPALLAALRTLGDAPTRSLGAVAQRLGSRRLPRRLWLRRWRRRAHRRPWQLPWCRCPPFCP
jgi:hypothetical protein